MRFARHADTGFWKSLRAEVDGQILAGGRSPLAPPALWIKAALFACLVAAGYAWLLDGPDSFGRAIAAYAIFNLASLLLVLGIAHDAAHDALTPNRTFNRIVAEAIFGLLGIDGHLWRMRHIQSHHVFPNINGCDADIDRNPFLRLSPNHPWKPRHRHQHLYALPLYAIVQLQEILVQDAIYIRQKSLANLRAIHHSMARQAGFVALKALYFTTVLALPIALSPLPWHEVAAAYVLSTAMASLLFVMLLIGTHFADGNAFPVPGEDGRIEASFGEHVFASSLDWSPTSRLATFAIGGLNAHAAHHLFPKVSHASCRQISRSISRLAQRHGIAYRRTSLPGMIAAHFRHLRRMGHPPAAARTSLPKVSTAS